MHDRVPRQRLYLHVGLAKTGTTYVQSLLRHHREALAAAGFCYPYAGPESMFRAAVEMASTPQRWGLAPEAVTGTFDALLAEGRRSGGTVVLSHELLSRADDSQVSSVLERASDFDVHVVLTVRDPARTVVAHWQEVVKGGRAQTLDQFLDARFPAAQLPRDPDDAAYEAVAKPEFADRVGRPLARWGAHVPAERLHVVVVPAPGAAPGLLRDRFAQALTLPTGLLDDELPDTVRPNASLGAPAIGVLRRVNETLDGRLSPQEHSHVVRRWFAQEVLAGLPGDRPVLPAAHVAAMDWTARRWIDDIARSGARTYGDPTELRVSGTDPSGRHPDRVPEAELVAVASAAIAELLLEVRTLRRQARRQAGRQARRQVQRQIQQAPAGPWARVRRRLGIRGDARTPRSQRKAR